MKHLVGWSLACCLLGMAACGDDNSTATGPGHGGAAASQDGSVGGTAATGGAKGGSGGMGGVPIDAGPSCPGGKKTTLSGTVLAPTKISPDPLPNVAVYVPAGPVEAFSPGVSCVRCGEESAFITRTVSKSDGTFVLEDVPAGTNVPIVLQAGRWRRQVQVPVVTACTDTALPAELSHLPRSQAEGDIPRMALQTGYVDGLECLLAKILDPAELTAPTGTGRVHLYKGSGADAVPALPPSSDLWGDAARLQGYDVAFFPCDFTTSSTEPAMPAAGVKNLVDYADIGGRLFLTHGGGKWLKETVPPPYPGLVQFNIQPDPQSPLPSSVDTSFPKGQVFAEWLVVVGVSTKLGEINVDHAQWYVDSVQPPAQRWIHSASPVTVQHFTFTTPITAKDGEECGRVLFSNFHVKAAPEGATFPAHCTDVDKPLDTNEKVIEYMLFDTTGCVQSDQDPVK
ncbi:MAG: carboxypeptidase regulatory-like domain-containing protein [Deltaproteobacteria bacterium]|nr:carboxypeptidase regulatory-like domain-containing protein [Deltaproteobacteria bacterium]